MPASSIDLLVLHTQESTPKEEHTGDVRKHEEIEIQILEQNQDKESQSICPLGKADPAGNLTVAQVMQALEENGCRTMTTLRQTSMQGIHIHHTVENIAHRAVYMACPKCGTPTDCVRIDNCCFLHYGNDFPVPPQYLCNHCCIKGRQLWVQTNADALKNNYPPEEIRESVAWTKPARVRLDIRKIQESIPAQLVDHVKTGEDFKISSR